MRHLLPQPSQRLTASPNSHYLLRNNARVVALSRTTTPELESLQQTHADSLLLCKGDVATEADNKRVVDLALAKFGQIDALIRKLASLYSPKIHSHLVNFAVNAATLSPLGTTASMHTSARLEEYRKLFEINYFSLISIIAHALPSLNLVKAGQDASLTGRIILVSSGAATKGVAGWGAYSSSKAAMNSLARTLGSEEKTVVTIAGMSTLPERRGTETDMFAFAVRPGVVDSQSLLVSTSEHCADVHD